MALPTYQHNFGSTTASGVMWLVSTGTGSRPAVLAPPKRCAATNFEGTGSTGGKEGDVCMATRKEGGNPLPSLLPLEPVPSKLVAAQRNCQYRDLR